MSDESCLPEIFTEFKNSAPRLNNGLYLEVIRRILTYILPSDTPLFLTAEPDLLIGQKEQLHSSLPLITWTLPEQTPATASFYSLSRCRPGSFKFFYQMISHWLVPGQRLDVVSVYSADIGLPALGDDVYTICEIIINLERAEQLREITQNLPIIANEVRLAIESTFYGRRILEAKGMAANEKTAQIQEFIGYLMHRLPRHFASDVLTEMQHVLILCQEEFKAQRDCRHLSRIISYQYLFRQALKDRVKGAPHKRHLMLKLFKARVGLKESKKVLGVTLAINFLREKEVLEKKHLLKAIQHHIPSAEVVENSFFKNRIGSDDLCTLYIEVFKSTGEDFTGKELLQLRRALPEELKNRIERLMHPIFMPRNEEEIIRNILSLSNQIKFVRDIPQVFITFDEQTHTNLYFTIVLVRIKRPGQGSIQELFSRVNTPLRYIHDRCQLAGSLRNRYKKEATVFRVKIAKEQFLRFDHSIDLNMARQVVVSELSRICGDLRDYNGGMISKQNELINRLKREIGEKVRFNPLLLEKFFYSIVPVVMRTILEPSPLINLFLMLLEALEKNEHFRFHSYYDDAFAYAMITTEDSSVKDKIHHALLALPLYSSQMGSSSVTIEGIHYLGYLFRSDDEERRLHFIRVLEKAFFAKNRLARRV